MTNFFELILAMFLAVLLIASLPFLMITEVKTVIDK